MTAESKSKKMSFTKEAKMLLVSYVLEMVLIVANLAVLLIGKQTNILLVVALLAVSLFTFIYAKKLKKANQLVK
ncbi:MAG: hypothetical protein ACRCWD_01975 [Culicoidibacterales bacterium]